MPCWIGSAKFNPPCFFRLIMPKAKRLFSASAPPHSREPDRATEQPRTRRPQSTGRRRLPHPGATLDRGELSGGNTEPAEASAFPRQQAMVHEAVRERMARAW